MFGSQVLETAIGLSLVFLFVSVMASLIVESISRWFKVRAALLDKAMTDLNGNATQFASVPKSLTASGLSKTLRPKLDGPSYTTAAEFARVTTNTTPGEPTKAETARFEALTVALSERYKRWSTMMLFFVGFGIAAAGNISAIDVTQQLWTNDVARASLVKQASGTQTIGLDGFRTAQEEACDMADGDDPPAATTDPPEAVAASPPTPDQVHQVLDLPFGWACKPTSLLGQLHDSKWPAFLTLLGWLITAGATILGAQFWFDLMGRFISLRPGTKPEVS